MANLITGIRVLASVGLLFCPALSPSFFALYLLAGLTDMIDGPVARKTHTATAFGAKLDTAADILFAAVCLVKLLPVMDVYLDRSHRPHKDHEHRLRLRDTETLCFRPYTYEQSDRSAFVSPAADGLLY